MKFSLKEIIDLDYFLSLDTTRNQDTEDTSDSRDAVAARDREIYREIETHDTVSIDVNDDTALLRAWLDRRRQSFIMNRDSRRRLSGQPEEQKTTIQLPGELFQALYNWGTRVMALIGGLLGFLFAYSFLAYHGSRPVNVTLFIALFIFSQAVMTLVAGVVLFRRMRSGNRSGIRYPLFL
ncbi:MAG: hypothetical protein CSA29_03070, partial [Desulfobacterales bacterium]